LISSQSSSPSTGSQTDQNGSPQQVLQVLVRSEGSDTLQVPLSKSDNSADLQNQFVKELREQLNSEIVKRGSIMVRNNGSGEIRLELKPDHLGQVKIHLSLENNNIAGRILVENISVKEAFDQNMQELYRAFKEHGFGETALNVSVGNHQRQKNAQKEANGPAGSVSGAASLQAMETEQSRTLQPTGEQRLVDVLA
jgi:flagellar hook-length control protein FliK